ncbi:hypothetical protein MP228_010668 [Amoeboaphelidium protococcarum]|nr:hypothetical protein MP228_010668 [Amoeboaphelidium protococcarum]
MGDNKRTIQRTRGEPREFAIPNRRDVVDTRQSSASSSSVTSHASSQNLCEEHIDLYDYKIGVQDLVTELMHASNNSSQPFDITPAQIQGVMMNVERFGSLRLSEMSLDDRQVATQLGIVSDPTKDAKVEDLREIQGAQNLVKYLIESCINLMYLNQVNLTLYKNVELRSRNMSANSVSELTAMTLRVFSPLTSKPDLMLSIKRSEGDQLKPDLVGPLIEVKKDSTLKADYKQSISAQQKSPIFYQAADYGISFLQRVFPMLSSHNVTAIFGQNWYVYVPLMSHKSMCILRVDATMLADGGRFEVMCSDLYQDQDMAKVLCAWLSWAVAVISQLNFRKDDINGLDYKNCWMPPQAIKKVYQHVDVTRLVAHPSYYNPLYVYLPEDESQDCVFKLLSFWSNSSNLLAPSFFLQSDLFQSAPRIPDSILQGRQVNKWKMNSFLLQMPFYRRGDLLHQPPSDYAQLINVLLQVINFLIRMKDEFKMAHCDIRPQNICWKSAREIILIDYDLVQILNKHSRKPADAKDSGPDDRVVNNYDLWSVGVLILQLCLEKSSFSWLNIVDWRDTARSWHLNVPMAIDFPPTFQWKIQYAPHKDLLQSLVSRCLQPQNFRISLEEMRALLQEEDATLNVNEIV